MACHLWIRWDSPAAGHLPRHLRTLPGLGHLGFRALAALVEGLGPGLRLKAPMQLVRG